VRRTFIETYRSLSDTELLKLLKEPPENLRCEARAALVRVVEERLLGTAKRQEIRAAAPEVQERLTTTSPSPSDRIAKQQKEGTVEEQEPPARRGSEFDIRYRELREIDRGITQLKSSGLNDAETRSRIKELEIASRRGWHELYVDIINREG
jgi:hypothetical protein